MTSYDRLTINAFVYLNLKSGTALRGYLIDDGPQSDKVFIRNAEVFSDDPIPHWTSTDGYTFVYKDNVDMATGDVR